MKEIILLGALAVLYKIGGRLFDRLDHFFEGLMPPRESSYEPEERNLEDGWKIEKMKHAYRMYKENRSAGCWRSDFMLH